MSEKISLDSSEKNKFYFQKTSHVKKLTITPFFPVFLFQPKS